MNRVITRSKGILVIKFLLIISCSGAQFNSGATRPTPPQKSEATNPDSTSKSPSESPANNNDQNSISDQGNIQPVEPNQVGQAVEQNPIDPQPKESEPALSPLPPPPVQQPEPPKALQLNFAFNSTEYANGSLDVDLSREFTDYQITMQRDDKDGSSRFQQRSRPVVVENFKQGSRGTQITESMKQSEILQLDILVMIDTSGSMEEELKSVSERMEPLISSIRETNWQIGVVTADTNDPCLKDLIRKTDGSEDQLRERFRLAITPERKGNQVERGFKRILEALQCNTTPWVRPSSAIAIIIISDEDNCSDNQASECSNEEKKYSYVRDYLSAINRRPGADARVYGLFWQPNTKCETGKNKAHEYYKLVYETNGTWGSICDSDFTPTLAEISEDMSLLYEDEVMLQHIPSDGLINVTVDDQSWAGKYVLTNNVIKFTTLPPASSLIKIQYYHGGSPLISNFRLGDIPDTGLDRVTVDSVIIDPSDYQLSSDKTVLTFDAPPPDNSTIEVRYKKFVLMHKIFATDVINIVPNSVRAYINDVLTTDYEFDYSKGEIKFFSPPQENSEIVVLYKIKGNPIVEYPFSPPYNDTSGLYVYDGNTANRVAFEFDAASAKIKFRQQDFINNRKLTIRYFSASDSISSLTLPVIPIKESIIIQANGKVCSDPSKIRLEGNQIYSSCDFGISETAHVAYKYILADKQQFTLDIPSPYKEGDFEWKVFVNDEERNDYVIENRILKFAVKLPENSRIMVKGELAD